MDKTTLDIRFRTTFIIWAGLLGGVTFFMGAVVALTTGAIGDWTPTLDPGLAGTLMILPISSMVGGIVFRRRELKRSGESEQRLNAYQTQVIIGGAMQEGGGLLGLALALAAGQPTWALGLWALTAVAMGLTRPRRDELDQLLR